MTRPDIIRADSIDLQDREAPSAQTHSSQTKQTKQVTNSPHGGALQPHQAETLREVAAETAEENLRSPRVSWVNGDAVDVQQYAEDLAASVTNSLNNNTHAYGYGNNNNMAAQSHQDNLAVAQNGGLMAHDNSEDGDMGADDDDMDDDDMDKISSSPSIEDEDIDFEFVYALHTFIATVEGQANATKGDTMVLLDDSNSYWWLVRVVKDSSIGYLPAEHIETPTERLARLNKHRNIDLSATMLGDQADKGKNPIKTVMRRRKAKTVTFAAPTYVDYSDFDYSTDEDEENEAEYYAQQQQESQQQQASATSTTNQVDDEQGDVESTQVVAPLKPRTQQNAIKAVDAAQQEGAEELSAARPANRTSEEIFETNGVEGPKKRADGTVRDSFFKDDTVETKKITLTPNLLRDDGTVRASTDSNKDLKQRPSLDKLEKDNVFAKDEKKKGKDKKEKEKKGGFRSLFSRKDKKQKGDEDDDSLGKRSMDVGTEEREAEEGPLNHDDQAAGLSPQQRQTSKLQKQQPRVEPSPTRKPGAPRDPNNGLDLATFLTEGKVNNVASAPPASMRIVEPDVQESSDNTQKSRGPEHGRSSSLAEQKTGPAVKVAPVRSQSNDDTKPVKPVKAKSRMQLDESSSDDEITPEPVRQKSAPEEKPKEQQQQAKQAPERPTLPGSYPDSYLSTQSVQSAQSDTTIRADPAPAAIQKMERLSESPVEVSPMTPGPPPLMVDTSSQEDHSSSPVSSPSPELIEREDAGGTHRNQDSITTSTSTTTVSTWNDTSLRAFFDSGSDIRDLLVVVYDKTEVEPVGPEHPIAGSLFKEQNAKLAEITTQLDHMLGDWLARKQRLRSTM